MYTFSQKSNELIETVGGTARPGVAIKDTFVILGEGMAKMRGVLYQPVEPDERASIGIVMIHAASDYSVFPIAPEMAKRGFTTLGSQVRAPEGEMDSKLVDVKLAVAFMRKLPWIKKVVLMGHSGGATLMTAYQRAAENGAASLKGDDMLYRSQLSEELIPADAIMLLDANMGNGAVTLFSVDPSVVETGDTTKIDPELDMFNPANGYDPEGSHYSATFLDKFFAAQRDRNNAIIDRALERLHIIESGRGFYADDEPFYVPGAAQYGFCNKIVPQDISLFAHTREPRPLLHKDGSITVEVVPSRRRAVPGRNPSLSINAAVAGTVRAFLSEHAVRALPDYRLLADGMQGVDWFHTYNCPSGNAPHVTAPMLVMGMTGGYEFLAAEPLFVNAGSADKTIAFTEGATHNFFPAVRFEDFPGQFGATEAVTFDYVAKWLTDPAHGLL